MEITRPSYEPLHRDHAWIARRRAEFENTSVAIRVVGAVGWTLMLLAVVTRAG